MEPRPVGYWCPHVPRFSLAQLEPTIAQETYLVVGGARVVERRESPMRSPLWQEYNTLVGQEALGLWEMQQKFSLHELPSPSSNIRIGLVCTTSGHQRF